VAVGMSSGFIEPLEASAIALVEMAATMIRDELPADRGVMDVMAKRYNQRFRYRWERVIDFLKLHYVLSKRTDSQYWLDHRNIEHIPDRLQELLALWKYQPPSRYDLIQTDEIFPAASYQYVLYGMGFETIPRATSSQRDNFSAADKHFNDNQSAIAKQMNGLPGNRELLDFISRKAM
jgi:hypothetical protein